MQLRKEVSKMVGKDWSLVVFTLLGQMAVGGFVVVWLTHLITRREASDAEVRKLCNAALLGVGPVVVLSLLVSLFHLGSPLNAWRAISNLGSSWLSREVFFILAFFVMWCVCAYMQWRGVGTERLRGIWAGLTGLVGLLAIVSSAMIYMLPTRPAWNSVATPISFLVSTFLLGALTAGAVFAVYYLVRGKDSPTQTALVREALRTIGLIAIAMILVQALTLALQMAYLGGGTLDARASGQLMLSTYGVWFWLRILIGIVAGLVLVWLGWRRLVGAETGMPAGVTGLAFGAFVVVLVGEIMGRVLFYATVVPVKLPGVG
jgi:anaerobic dimethyl sulfoxide reductase subunit C (anchor subunit)